VGRENTEMKLAQHLLIKSLDNPDKFSNLELIKMLKTLVPYMSKYEIERILTSIGYELLDLE
jgi:hypothetical protein